MEMKEKVVMGLKHGREGVGGGRGDGKRNG